MTYRLQNLLTGFAALIMAALLALAPAGANPTSGGYQLFEPVALEHQHAIQLASLENFDYHAKTASECCTATNRGGGLLWGSWNDYPKITVGGRTYAQIGNRQYSRHAVDRMQPSGLGTPVGADGPGRNVTPNMVEEVIGSGTPSTTIVGGVERTIYRSGNVSVVTEGGGNTIVTILRHSSP